MAIWTWLILLTGCVQGHCRHQVEVPEAQPVAGGPAAPSRVNLDKVKVFVYKNDGSQQCGMGKAVSPEVMAKELSGIPIFSSKKQSDGLMHIQSCGSITGQINIYEIPAGSLKRAESKGFKEWTTE